MISSNRVSIAGFIALALISVGAFFVFTPLASAAENPTTGAASAVTTTTATLNATNGTFIADLGGEAIWYGPTSAGPFSSAADPSSQVPVGWTTGFATTIDEAAGAAFSRAVAGLTPNTTYYFAAWSQVGGIWYPGSVESFTTTALTQTIVDFNDPADVIYGDAAFDVSVGVTGGGSGNAITFSTTAAASICTVSGAGLVTIIGVGTCDVSADQAGGGAYSAAPTVTHSFDIAARTVTLTGATVNNKTYDGDTTASFSVAGTVNNLVGAETLTLTPSFADKNVATGKSITVNLTDGTGLAANYTLTDPLLIADITVRDLNITASDLAAATKTYDGTTSVNPEGAPTYSYDALQGGDTTVTVTLVPGTSALALRDVGAQTVTFSGYVLGGIDAGNYNLLNQPANESQTVNPLAISVDAVTDTKVYDSNTTSVGIPTITPALVGGDTTTSLSQSFSTKDVGAGNKTLVPSVVINDGNGGNNYSVTLVNFTTGTITAKLLTFTGTTVTTKVYDDTTTATLVFTNPALVGVEAGDIANVAPNTALATGVFTTSNVGTNIPVTVTGITLLGSEAGNYSLTQPAPTGEITARPLTVTAQTDTKEYDGTTVSAVVPVVDALQGGDTVGTAPIQTFDTADIGTGKTLTAAGLVVNDGNGGANYSVSYVADTTGEITKIVLTVTAVTDTKIYDSTTSSSGAPIVTGTIAPGQTGNFIQTFDTKNIGIGKTLTPSGTVMDGPTDVTSNYDITFVADTTGEITVKVLTITADNKTKVYGDADPVLTHDGVLLGTDTFTGGLSRDAGQDVGTYAINQGSLNAGTNYAITYNSGTFEITTHAITVVADDNTKVYGASDPALTYQITVGALQYADAFTGDISRVVGEDVGTYAIGQNTLTLSANYVLTFTDGTFEITKKTLTVTADDESKVYGDADPAFTVQYSGFELGDDETDLTVQPTASVPAAHVNVGTYDIVPAGGSDDNYDFSYVNGDLEITQKGVTVTADAGQTKVYGDADPVSFTYTADALVGADVYSGALDRIAGENAGTYAIGQGSLTAGSNYLITFVADDFEITPRPITVTAGTNTKVYDATTTAATLPTITVGTLASGDTAIMSETYDTKNVGVGKTLTPVIVITDGNGGANYSVTLIDDITGVITEVALTINFTADNKQFDGNTSATIAGTSIVGVIAPDDVSVSGGTAAFLDSAVGTGKEVGASGFVLGGTDAGNYSIGTTGTTTADITAVPPAPSGGGGGGGGSGGSLFFTAPVFGTPAPTATTPSAPQGQVLGAAAYNFATNLTIGSRGADVTELQKVLIAGGFLEIAAPTGYFGALTRAAVQKYQAARSIAPQSGFVGPLTRAALNQGSTTSTTTAQQILSLQDQLVILQAQLKALLGL